MIDSYIDESWDSVDEHIEALIEDLLVLLKKYNQNIKYDLCTKDLSNEIICLKAKLQAVELTLTNSSCKKPTNVLATYINLDPCAGVRTSLSSSWSNTCSEPTNVNATYSQVCGRPTSVTSSYLNTCNKATNISAAYTATCDKPRDIRLTYTSSTVVSGCKPIVNFSGAYVGTGGTASQLTFTWTAPSPAPDSYTIYYREKGTLSYTYVNLSGTSWTKTGLLCCKGYEGYVISRCGESISDFTSFDYNAINGCTC